MARSRPGRLRLWCVSVGVSQESMFSLRTIRPLRQRIRAAFAAFPSDQFRVISGSDAGWFGDGTYILSDGREWLRITRFRGEESIEVAFGMPATGSDWLGVAELMVAAGTLTFEVAVTEGLPLDLDYQLAAYRQVHPHIASRLGSNPAAHPLVVDVRRKSREHTQQKYGRRVRD
jgi:hypothetical protein